MLIPVILSGGVGSRLWPLSRKDKPKHFMPLIKDNGALDPNSDDINNMSLLQQTIMRCSKEYNQSDNPFTHNPILVCDTEHRFLVADQCHEVNIKPEHILLEPIRKDTAAAIILAAMYVHKEHPDAVILVTPSDHYMADSQYYLSRIKDGLVHAENDRIVTFGIKPSYPETGYGYINADSSYHLLNDGYRVAKFIEKPDLATAIRLLEAPNCFWNSGMFMFKAEVILEICKTFQPDLYKHCLETVESAKTQYNFVNFKRDSFDKISPLSIDYALMQDTKDMIVMPYNSEWADVGCWHGVWQNSPRDENSNVVMGNVIQDNNKNCYLRSDGRLIVTLGVENVAVIETPDAVLVADINSTQDLRKLVDGYMDGNRKEFIEHSHAHRPWGEFTVLSYSENYKVKKLVIKPGASLSLQSHNHRDEHWVVVAGEADIIKEDETLSLKVNETLHIPAETKHRITNNHKSNNLEIIEVQVGKYLGEDDIIRYHDIYGRI